MWTATGCRQPVSGEDVAFHDLSAGLFTLIIRQVLAAGPALLGFAEYARETSRTIPVVALTPTVRRRRAHEVAYFTVVLVPETAVKTCPTSSAGSFITV